VKILDNELRKLRNSMKSEFPRNFEFNHRMKENIRMRIKEPNREKRNKSLGPILTLAFTIGVLTLFVVIGGRQLGFLDGNNAANDNQFVYQGTEEILELDEEYNIPKSFPFKVVESSVNTAPSGNMYTVDFFGEHNEQITLRITENEEVFSVNLEREDVNIGKLSGKYVVNENGVQLLSWKEGDTFYTLANIPNNTETEITKDELITVANSSE
jgi:hypothetical protein